MMMSLRRQLICTAFLLLAMAVPALAQTLTPQTLPFPWWKSEPFKKELGLSADQSGRIDKIWETTRPELRGEWDELSKLEAKLSHLIQRDADEALLSRQIDRVESARANANKTRSLMLVQMLKVLTPDQRVRFKTLHDRWQQDAHKAAPNRGKTDQGRSEQGKPESGQRQDNRSGPR
jgi:Spy/CpxP family protein refolding chaperone